MENNDTLPQSSHISAIAYVSDETSSIVSCTMTNKMKLCNK